MLGAEALLGEVYGWRLVPIGSFRVKGIGIQMIN